MSVFDHLRSAVTIAWITTNLLLWSVPLLVLALAKLLLPAVGRPMDALMDRIYRAALAADDLWLRRVMGIRWERPALGLERDESLIVVANHTSWSDFLILQSVIVSDGPLLKVLAKRELVFVPILGLILWAFDFPILRRRSRGAMEESERRRRDLDALRRSCRVVRERPAALLSFAEGTRFTEEKRVKQGSAYRHLLEPRVGGLAMLLDALDGECERLVDLTLIYPERAGFWPFLAGRVQDVGVEAEIFAVADLPASREGRAAWLGERWSRKDARIEAARTAAGADAPTGSLEGRR